ncbi:hypothetical protein BO85DRAFT_472563 [Aspergillus piperis CBS 112811]|uniref:Uncharacterized protein n=1 Tax=Aspergillus piperis CBS 112811 TaxID=1448313 RepID=A0A8G1QUQ5_9EURO|nr:hypothetical protein BO85DRAFT_472563 [Aspergillus piperis CBS 112811]RAH52560.1 hypothetical protein BO85DRAFT_472563 [Aspergillus piperis CBS 112811]
MGTHDTPHSLSLCHTYAPFSLSLACSPQLMLSYYASHCILDYHNHPGLSTAFGAAGFTTTAGPLAPTNSVAGNHCSSNSIPASFSPHRPPLEITAILGNGVEVYGGCIYLEGLVYVFCMEKSSLPWNMDPNFISVGQSYSTVRRTPPTTLVGENFIRLLSIGSSAGFCLALQDY